MVDYGTTANTSWGFQNTTAGTLYNPINFTNPIVVEERMSVDIINVAVTSDAAIVELEVNLDDLGYYEVISGTAKRHPTDKPNEDTALHVAYSKAFGKLARKLEKRASGLVKHNDDMRAAKREANGLSRLKAAATRLAEKQASEPAINPPKPYPAQSGGKAAKPAKKKAPKKQK